MTYFMFNLHVKTSASSYFVGSGSTGSNLPSFFQDQIVTQMPFLAKVGYWGLEWF